MSIKIGKTELISWIFLLAIWLPSEAAGYIPGISILKFGGLLWSVYLFLNYKLYNEKAIFLCWLWLAWALIATIINGSDISVCFAMVHPLFSTICMVKILLKRNNEKALKQILNVFCLWTIIQFITFIQLGPSFGNVINEVSYFFGIRVDYNDFFVFALGCVVLAILLEIKKAKLQFVIIIGLGIYFAYSCKLSTSIMACLIFICIFILSYFAKSDRLWRGMGIISIIFCLLFAFGSAKPEKFSWLLVDFLGEDLTLNGRTVIWMKALEQMKGIHWIIGNGYAHHFEFRLSQYWSATTAHSQYINAIFCFGAIGLLIYITMLLKIISLVRLIERRYWPVVIATAISMILMGISTTFYTSPYMFVWFVVSTALVDGDFKQTRELKRERKN